MVSACGTSDSGVSAGKQLLQCSVLTGGSVSFGTIGQCLNCVFTDADLAIDGDFSTYATLTFPASANGGGYIEARPQEGVVFSEGSRAAVGLEVVKAGSAETMTTGSFATYQGDDVKEQVNFENANPLDVYGVGGGIQTVELNTTEAFNGLRVSLDGTFNNQSLRVYEFCGDSDSE